MLQLTFSAMQIASAIASVFVFQFVAAKAFWGKHQELLDERFKRVFSELEGVKELLEKAEKKQAKTEKRITNLEQALASNRIRIRSIDIDDEEELDG